jgi:hypothetical protein
VEAYTGLRFFRLSGTVQTRGFRTYLAGLPRDRNSPFAEVSSTHMARLAVLDDVVYVGAPTFEEHLESQYLVFESNFDGDVDIYLTRMARETPDFVDSVWKHCVGYPGVTDPPAFTAYMKRCQVETTFYFAPVNNKTVQQTLRALQTQRAVAAFILQNQGKPGAELQKAFANFRRLSHPASPGIDAQVES